MTYYHNVQQTRNSGLDREMRLAAGEILSLFYGSSTVYDRNMQKNIKI